MSGTPPGPSRLPLIAEATRRAGLIWITVPGRPPRPAWHVWRDAAYVLTGPGEQHVPGLAVATRVTVTTPSKDTGASLVSWAAEVSRVDPESAEWAAVIGALLAGRLNPAAPPGEPGPGGLNPAAPPGEPGPGGLAGRWARDGAVYRLRPASDVPFDAGGAAP
jgi:hypothetical protein